ncbi:cytochrome c oxidase assembly protein [Virgibacillus alimentarius]|uniref:Membrane protein n=1 Tax=Virgibacillus alimentarius TaxID=698769 RepID=A0ABS4S8X9_9BACI|nr:MULTISPECIES: cytochrome c oxidase assembly protein [Virgibacillus]MBP2256852.1 putative membrane protein [Virgibacillus alimentarius]HLR69534.1 cytochrome c oxidase assembly protein [Virgibacillus sp.]
MMYEVLLEDHMQWNIPWLIGLVAIACFYFFLIKYWMKMNLKKKQSSLFVLCLCLVYLSLGSPFAGVSHASFSLHMIQMSIIYFIIPPLFLLGIPSQIIEYMRKKINLRKKKFILFLPFITLCIFAILFFFYHMPFVLTLLSKYPAIHKVYGIILFILAVIMWWPIAGTANRQLPKKKKKRYAFLSSLLIMPACVIFIVYAFMDGMTNPFLNELTTGLCFAGPSDPVALLPPPFNTKFDQIAAGLSMMIMHKLGIILTYKVNSLPF